MFDLSFLKSTAHRLLTTATEVCSRKSVSSQQGFAAVILMAFVALVLVGAGGGGSYYYASEQKKELKSLTRKQSENFSNLEEKYKKIVDTYKQSKDDANSKKSVLGVTYEKGQVLGVEDSASVVFSRQLLELYRDAKANTKQIQTDNDAIKEKANNPLVKPFLGTTLPTEKTDQFVTETDAIITYLEKSTDIQIKASTVGYDLGVSLGKAIIEPTEEQIQALEAKIKEFKELADESREATGTGIPKGLEESQTKGNEAADKIVTEFDKIPTLLRNKDAAGLEALFRNIGLAAGVEGQKGEVALMTFWQSNPTIRQVEELKNDWSNSSNKL